MKNPIFRISLISAIVGVCFYNAPSYACDENCEDTIDKISQEARFKEQSVARGENGAAVLEYGAGIPVLKCRPLNFCSIQLQPGEIPIEDITLGDSLLWDASLRVSGTQDEPNVRIVIKPDELATQTSLIITTDRRFYDIQLIKSNTDYTNTLSFIYPADIKKKNADVMAKLIAAQLKNSALEAQIKDANSIDVGATRAEIGSLDFNYFIRGNTQFKPTRVFNDGVKTYIDLPEKYLGEKPIFLAGTTEKLNEIVNTRWNNNRLTVDRIFENGMLVHGVGGRAKKIKIFKGAYKR